MPDALSFKGKLRSRQN